MDARVESPTIPASPPPPAPARPSILPAPYEVLDEDVDVDDLGRIVVRIRRADRVVAVYAVPAGRTLVLSRLVLTLQHETSRDEIPSSDRPAFHGRAPTPPSPAATAAPDEVELHPVVVSTTRLRAPTLPSDGGRSPAAVALVVAGVLAILALAIHACGVTSVRLSTRASTEAHR